jgi:phospholipid/cholesterol/gamma-HCH transport system substrate-binding protein
VTFRLRPLVPWISGAVVVLLIAGFAGWIFTGGAPTKTIAARFAEAPGLYDGNHVDVLGIPVGTITSIKPEPGYVQVTMQVRKDLRIPADAGAELMAPEVVADRFVQLVPAYSGGPTMPPGAVIPLSRTVIPQSVDQVISSLTELAQQLGPNGANKHGALTRLVHELAVQFGDTGPDFHSAVVNFSEALAGISQNSAAVGDTLDNLGNLSQALANNSSTYASFSANLAAVSQILAGDRSDIASALSALQQLFANLTSFIQADGGSLGASISNLKSFAAALGSQQAALAQAFSLAPLSLQNLDNAIDLNAPGGAAIRGRYDPVASTATLFNQVCGSASLRFLVLLATGTETNPLTVATSTDTLCGIGNALNALTPPPDAAQGPDLTLRALTS